MFVSYKATKAITYWFAIHASFAHISVFSFLTICSLAAWCALLSWQARLAFGSWLADGTGTTVETWWAFASRMTGCTFAATIALCSRKYRISAYSTNAQVRLELQ